ncbi:MAG: hypothetical protein K6G26_07740, partial [Lachnospiraceae bacterium]|nr:hypothetical protein [Lachnospiraceae bacterium]
YYLSPADYYKFDVDDLFYYSNHKIMKRGSHLFVSDYGMQVNVLSRYGIKNYAMLDKDYYFLNGDCKDLRYNNIKVINKYYGVSLVTKDSHNIYVAKIHINGNYIIGRYSTEAEAAVAYNKAVDILEANGLIKNYQKNYIDNLSEIEYSKMYNEIRINKKIKQYRTAPL